MRPLVGAQAESFLLARGDTAIGHKISSRATLKIQRLTYPHFLSADFDTAFANARYLAGRRKLSFA